MSKKRIEIIDFLDKEKSRVVAELDGNSMPEVDDVIKALDTSFGTVLRTLRASKYGSLVGYKNSVRASILESMALSGCTDHRAISKAIGFGDFRSLYRFTRSVYNCTPDEYFEMLSGVDPVSRHLYVHEFPNSNIKFGVSRSPEMRLKSVRNHELSGKCKPVKTYISESTSVAINVEKMLIDLYKDKSIGLAREWLNGVDFDHVVEKLVDFNDNFEVYAHSGNSDFKDLVIELRSSGFVGFSDFSEVSDFTIDRMCEWMKGDRLMFDVAIESAKYRIKCQ